MAGLGLAGASFYKTRRQSQEYLEQLRELNTFHSTLTRLMQNSSHCNATFKRWDRLSQVPGTASNDIKEIILCRDGCSDNSRASTVNTVMPAPQPLIIEALTPPTYNLEWLPINISNLANRQRNWRVRDIAVWSPLTKTGKLELKIMYELYPGRTDSKRVLKTLAVNLKFNKSATPVFITCASDKESSLRSTLEEMCETLNKTVTGPAIATWNHDYQRCDLNNYNPCPSPSSIAGITNQGTSTCSSYTTGVQGSSVFQNATSNCTSGKIPVVDISSDGRLRVVCN